MPNGLHTYDVVVVGLLAHYDLPQRSGGATRLLSKGINQAVAVARLGGRVALVGSLPSKGAPALLTLLQDEGVECASVVAQGAKTLDAEALQRAQRFIQQSAVMLTQLELPVATVQCALRLARAYGVRTVLDPAPPAALPNSLLSLVDLLRPNAQEASVLSGMRVNDGQSARAAARTLLRRGVRAVFCQAGHDGNLLMTEDETRWMAHLNVDAVDPQGAGDACAAALAVALAERRSMCDAAGWGHVAAALATTRQGAYQGLPHRAQIVAKLGDTQALDLTAVM